MQIPIKHNLKSCDQEFLSSAYDINASLLFVLQNVITEKLSQQNL
jgi:hypothetical protein